MGWVAAAWQLAVANVDVCKSDGRRSRMPSLRKKINKIANDGRCSQLAPGDAADAAMPALGRWWVVKVVGGDLVPGGAGGGVGGDDGGGGWWWWWVVGVGAMRDGGCGAVVPGAVEWSGGAGCWLMVDPIVVC